MATRLGKDRDDHYQKAWEREAQIAKAEKLNRYYDKGNNSCIEYKGVHLTEMFTGGMDNLKTHYELQDGRKFDNLDTLMELIDTNKL